MNLYTIGYEGVNIDRFMQVLNDYNVSVLIDVRRKTFSRRKDFSRNTLIDNLSNCNIEYKALEDLGTPDELRNDLKKTGNYDLFFAKYRRFLKNKSSYLNAIIELLEEENTVVLLCYEKDHEKCHRKIVAEEIKRINGNGIVIKPIICD